jgi:Zn-dependent metalloprotease
LNIKNSKKVKIREKLQTITKTFEEYKYDMDSINDEWLIHFENKEDNIKFVVEISSVDETINNFKIFIDNQWIIYSENNFNNIINLSRKKITELYGEKVY